MLSEVRIMTPDTPLQDAVTLAADLQRTPLQHAAKRVHDALVEAQYAARQLISTDVSEEHFADQVRRDIERLFHPLAHLMHEGDCE